MMPVDPLSVATHGFVTTTSDIIFPIAVLSIGYLGGGTPAIPVLPMHKNRGGARPGNFLKTTYTQKKQKDYIDIRFESALTKINEKTFENLAKQQIRYRMEYAEFNIMLSRIKHNQNKPIIYTEMITNIVFDSDVILASSVKTVPYSTIITNSRVHIKKAGQLFKVEAIKKKKK